MRKSSIHAPTSQGMRITFCTLSDLSLCNISCPYTSIRMEEAEMVTYNDIYFYLAMALAAFLVWEIISLLLQRKL